MHTPMLKIMDCKILILSALVAGFLGIASHASAQPLRDALIKMTKTNPQIRAAEQNRLSIDQALNQAKAAYLPQVKASGSYGPTTSRNTNTIASVLSGGTASTVTMPTRQANLTVDQTVFDGFATQGEVGRNMARANSAAKQLLTTMQDATLTGTLAYIEILHEQKLIDLAQQNYDEHVRIYHMIQARVQKGLSSRADLKQVEGRVSLAQSNLLAEKSNYLDAIARYQEVMGTSPKDLILPAHIPEKILPKSEKEAILLTQKYHPTIQSARFDIHAAQEQYNVAKAGDYPKLQVELGVDRNQNVGGVRGPDNDQFIMAKVSYDIFTGGATVSRQQESAHLLSQAQEIMKNAYRQATQETHFAWNSWVTAKRVLPLLLEHRNATMSTISAYKKQFMIGRRTLLDFLDIQNEYFAAGRASVDGEFKILASEYQLMHSTGRLMQALRIPLPDETMIYDD